MVKRNVPYDPACADLARHFLESQPGATADDTATIDALASEIQQTIEAFFADLEAAREADLVRRDGRREELGGDGRFCP
jgi:hypothetical protein